MISRSRFLASNAKQLRKGSEKKEGPKSAQNQITEARSGN